MCCINVALSLQQLCDRLRCCDLTAGSNYTAARSKRVGSNWSRPTVYIHGHARGIIHHDMHAWPSSRSARAPCRWQRSHAGWQQSQTACRRRRPPTTPPYMPCPRCDDGSRGPRAAAGQQAAAAGRERGTREQNTKAVSHSDFSPGGHSSGSSSSNQQPRGHSAAATPAQNTRGRAGHESRSSSHTSPSALRAPIMSWPRPRSPWTSRASAPRPRRHLRRP